ncbi:MAG: hypothetical protein ABEI52_04170, partial [Halobacteriaceae archaeon]
MPSSWGSAERKQATESVGQKSIDLWNHVPDQLPDSAQIEAETGAPSLQYLYFTEMKARGLTRVQANKQTRELAGAYERVFDRHSFECTFQSKGSEIHRLLAHYYTVANGGTPIWRVFSPFEGKRALSTRIDTQWYSYTTIPYSDIESSDRERVRRHIAKYLDKQRLQDYVTDESGGWTKPWKHVPSFSNLIDPNRPTNRNKLVRRSIRKRC